MNRLVKPAVVVVVFVVVVVAVVVAFLPVLATA